MDLGVAFMISYMCFELYGLSVWPSHSWKFGGILDDLDGAYGKDLFNRRFYYVLAPTQ